MKPAATDSKAAAAAGLQPQESAAERRARWELELLAEMLSAFRPARCEDPSADFLTTEELLSMMSGTFRPDINTLALALHAAGYRTALVGGALRWMMRRADTAAD